MSVLLVLVLVTGMAAQQTLADPTFVSTPGAIGTYWGGSVTLDWELSESVTEDWKSVTFYYDTPNISIVLTWNIEFHADNPQPNQNYGARITPHLSVGPSTVGYTLNNTRQTDVEGKYRCVVKASQTMSTSDDTAWIFIYGQPSVPVISGHSNVTETALVVLTCIANTTSTFPSSVPGDLRPRMEYTWKRDGGDIPADGRHSVNGSILTIDGVTTYDSMVPYTCTSQEYGSRLISDNTTHTLNVQYSYRFCENPNKKEEASVGDSKTISVCLSANPVSSITSSNWRFQPRDTTSATDLPAGVTVRTHDSTSVYINNVQLIISRVNESHYGLYTLTVGNGIGGELVYSVSLIPAVPVVMIAGICAGVLLVVIIVVVIVVVCRKKKRSKTKEAIDDSSRPDGLTNQETRMSSEDEIDEPDVMIQSAPVVSEPSIQPDPIPIYAKTKKKKVPTATLS